ncbi:MAG TPA: hypothetical protein VIB08_08385, partial [Thermoanaerobaculia bacterium]
KNIGGLDLSPDGRRVAVTAGSPTSADVWLYDFGRDSWEQMTSGGINFVPVFTPDGKQIFFASNRDGVINTFRMPIDRSAPPEQVTNRQDWPFPLSFTPDGRTLLLGHSPPATSSDLAVLSLEKGAQIEPLIATAAQEQAGRLSPDGRWLAYQSNESGVSEIYVRAFRGAGRVHVSNKGGIDPMWGPDGREIFYRAGGTMMAARIETAPELRADAPRALFKTPFLQYDVAPDGRRFLVIRAAHPDLPPSPLVVVLGWSAELERRSKGG